MSDLEATIRFLQKLIQTPSLPGEEGEVAHLVMEEMRHLGYDETWMDEAGNVIGLIRGQGDAPAVMFNTHLDHVDPGNFADWPEYGQPYSGALHDDKVWGRATSDIKGPLAAQVYGVARLLQGQRPPGDVYVTVTVQEEIGGLGARLLAQAMRDTVKLVVIGEPSLNQLRRGHRGRTEVIVRIRGRSVHASVPEQGVNPLYIVGEFLRRLPTMEMAQHEELGSSTVAPTMIRTDQKSTNVTPGELWLTLDWRNVPGERAEDARDKVAALLEECLIDGAQGEALLKEEERLSFTGYGYKMLADNPPYSLPADHPAVLAAEKVLQEQLGLDNKATLWRFATDGGHFAQVGMTVIGIGPGDERVIHTVNEHIAISQLDEALRINETLAREWAVNLSA